MQGSQPLKAAAWMMGAVVSFVAMAVAGREAQAEMNTFELMLYRSAAGEDSFGTRQDPLAAVEDSSDKGGCTAGEAAPRSCGRASS